MNSPEIPALEKAPGMDTNKKIMLGLAVAMVVVVIGMFIWKSSAVSVVESKLVEVQAQEAQARADLIERVRQQNALQEVESLKRFSVPLAWAIRRELMASNLDQIDQYLTELVQMPAFQSAVLASPDDKVIVASDRKKLAEAFSAIYPGEYLQAKEVKVEPAANGGLWAIIPIMGLNQQLGTLVVEFSSPASTLQ